MLPEEALHVAAAAVLTVAAAVVTTEVAAIAEVAATDAHLINAESTLL